MSQCPPGFIKLTCFHKYQEGDEENTIYIQINQILSIEVIPALPDRVGIPEAYTQIALRDKYTIGVREPAEEVMALIRASCSEDVCCQKHAPEKMSPGRKLNPMRKQAEQMPSTFEKFKRGIQGSRHCGG